MLPNRSSRISSCWRQTEACETLCTLIASQSLHAQAFASAPQQQVPLHLAPALLEAPLASLLQVVLVTLTLKFLMVQPLGLLALQQGVRMVRRVDSGSLVAVAPLAPSHHWFWIWSCNRGWAWRSGRGRLRMRKSIRFGVKRERECVVYWYSI